MQVTHTAFNYVKENLSMTRINVYVLGNVTNIMNISLYRFHVIIYNTLLRLSYQQESCKVNFDENLQHGLNANIIRLDTVELVICYNFLLGIKFS